ncbi:OPT family small oligopeptide transporter [Blastomyces silverae]|uniref:OPT family small oligopeptide transporter n=1 Tax=Blastomyces silverae TaxID=2060906 RepID=A0A0H1B3G4_9EURO|nr:OPT family small oligopeptide transporter [Blastomyces silverae]
MVQASKGFQAMRARMRGHQPDNDDGISTELGAHATSTAMDDIQKFKQSHQFDPNLPQEHIDAVRHAAEAGDTEKATALEQELIEDSPYPEVRAAVRNTDEELVANTVRAWILGFIFITVGGGLNMFLSMRSPAISFPSIVVQLLVYPIGCFWAKVVPGRVFNIFGLRWTFNPGPFTIKEHTVVTLMANVSITYAYSTDALLALKGKEYFNIDMGWGFQLLFTLSSQLIGISLAGLFRRFCVWPSSMMWPAVFSNTSLLYALHDKSGLDPSMTNGWSISRYRWFMYLGLASFVYYWFPGVIWEGLGVFCFLTWIKPNNVVVNQLFGGFTGLSLIPLTFDWTYISSYLLSPMLSPTHSHVNTLIGLVVFVIATSIGITYSGALYAEYLPINTSSTFDNTQNFYNVSRILGPDFTFDVAKYKEYSPLFLPPTFALNYGLSFAALTAVIVHIILFHRNEIMYRLKAAKNQESDIHMKLMQKYPECPEWWYGGLFLLSLAFGLVTCEAYASQLPWWAFFISVVIGLVFVIPTCMLMAITNIRLSLNVISPFIGGYLIPGKAIGVMVFKVFATNTLAQAQTFAMDLKLAHYMKIPPKTTFTCQVFAVMWTAFVQIAVMNWTLGNIDGVCTPAQTANFTCPNGKTFFSSAIVWGVIGPDRMFGPGSLYESIQWFWLLGALFPVLFYVLIRMFPRSPARLLNAPVMLGAMAWLPPATPLSFASWAIIGLIFNFWIRRRWPGWWQNYNYITSAALDTGLVLATIVIFFALTFPKVEFPSWWGNRVPYETLDYMYKATLKTVREGETFGPTTWKL